MTMQEAFLWQASQIRATLKFAEDATALMIARNMLELVRPAWLATGQEFARDLTNAMQANVISRARELQAAEREFLAGERVNSRHRVSGEREIRELTDIIGSMQ